MTRPLSALSLSVALTVRTFTPAPVNSATDTCTSTSKARYRPATKLNSTRSTLWKIDKVDHDALTPDTLATKLTVSATKSTATNNAIQVVADLLPKPATKLTISAKVDFVANLSPVLATVDFVTSVYRA